ncbi:outer membrane protein [Bradyrhizobium liaoningense]|uniref:outer membrane protein n=1 Tax=Bradyrhizobium liaoningense TaxID=43992 RepID=UPI001BA66E14|nr:porin family protein [Bradyrhizobium liaoningense]MBR0715985.1 porin family protein [Bradyrhizobium liaoningense]
MMKSLWAAALMSILFTGAAAAADMPLKAAPRAVAAVYDWTGFYVGGNVGYGWGEGTNPSISAVDPGGVSGVGAFLSPAGIFPGFSSGNIYPGLNSSGVFGGLQLGYDKQFGNWVVGVVADIQGADFKSSGVAFTNAAATCCNVTESISAKIDWFGTLRGKAGFAANDWLFYGTGGLAYGNTSSSLGFACTPGGVGCGFATIGFTGTASEVKVGWAAGAGVSKAFGNWNVGVEYLHIDLGRSSVTATSTTGFFTTTTITASQRFIEDTARLTVNYKWGGSVVAKY